MQQQLKSSGKLSHAFFKKNIIRKEKIKEEIINKFFYCLDSLCSVENKIQLNADVSTDLHVASFHSGLRVQSRAHYCQWYACTAIFKCCERAIKHVCNT